MTHSLHNRILYEIRSYTQRQAGAWVAWCDPDNTWGDLLRSVLRANDIKLVEISERTAGHFGGPVTRATVQTHIDAGQPFVLRLVAHPDDLGWLWGQALRAEHIYSRTLRDQLSEWGWRPHALNITDDDLKVLVQQHLSEDPAAWGSGGVEPDLDLLLRKLVYASTIEPMEQVLVALSAECAGLPKLDLVNMVGWRARAIAHLLVTDAHRRVPALVPETHDLVIAHPARVLAMRLLDTWVDSHALSKELPRAIDEAEAIAALDTLMTGRDVAYGPFVSRGAEHAIFAAVCERLGRLQHRELLETCATLYPSIQRHAESLWAQEGRIGGSFIPWTELARLCKACADIQLASPKATWASPTAAIEWYTQGGWQVDRAGEELLRNLSTSDSTLVALISPLREAFRARWEQQLMQWSEVWTAANCPKPAFPTAGERLRTILDAHRATVIIVLDALRYDLGSTLAEKVNEQEMSERASVLAARAPLPSVTALGMGQALPIAEDDLVAEVIDGKWVLHERNDTCNLSIAAKRRDWWVTHGHVSERALLTVPQALSAELPAPGRDCPRLVIYDDAIDALGHDEELEAAGSQDVLRRYVQVIQRVRDAGWRRIAVVTDHGYIHWTGTHDQRVTLPVAQPLYVSRRACAFPAGTPVAGPRGVAPGGAVAVAVPSGVACFSAYGKRGYFHGGASLQEWIIPVVLIDWPARAKPVEVALRPGTNVLSQRPRITLDVVTTTLLLDEVIARDIEMIIRDTATHNILFTSERYAVKPTDTTVDVMLKLRSGARAARHATLVIEVRDPNTEALITSIPSQLMIEIDEW